VSHDAKPGELDLGVVARAVHGLGHAPAVVRDRISVDLHIDPHTPSRTLRTPPFRRVWERRGRVIDAS
jgi:hypothetical protein